VTTFARSLGRRLIGVLALALAALAVTASPAHASPGATQTIDVQLTTYSNYGYLVQVGRVYGTIQFDTNNTQFSVSLVVCRQSSYTSPNVRFNVNGSASGVYNAEDSTRRPQICGGWGTSGVIAGTFSYGTTVAGVGVGVEGIYFDGSSARSVGGGAYADNPYN